MAMRLIFVRHGESEANVQRVYSNRGWNHPLTEKGRQQARALAEKLAGRGVKMIYASPVRRAVETATVIAEHLGVPHEVAPALAEYDMGIFEDRSHDEGVAIYDQIGQCWAQGDW